MTVENIEIEKFLLIDSPEYVDNDPFVKRVKVNTIHVKEHTEYIDRATLISLLNKGYTVRILDTFREKTTPFILHLHDYINEKGEQTTYITASPQPEYDTIGMRPSGTDEWCLHPK